MILNVADNIVSPLGFTSDENWAAVLRGDSALALHEGELGVPEPFFGGTFDNLRIDERFAKIAETGKVKPHRPTKFEKIAILSAENAIKQANIDPTTPDVRFVISTTKGNVELLDNPNGYDYSRLYLWSSAKIITEFFGNVNEPVIVSNACISGCVAQIVAERLLLHDRCRYVVVIGADVLSKFVVSGFQSFKSLSPELCRPFDAERCGLNLGEAAATIVYARSDDSVAGHSVVGLEASAICNDANHISAPSRTGEGQLAALEEIRRKALKSYSQAAFVSAHGTATRYNDDMESVALERAGMSHIPVNSLKGYFGHTLGAAGVLEAVISKYELTEKMVLKTKGTENIGTVSPVNVVMDNLELADSNSFIKIISGFGGSNAALLFRNMKGENYG